MLPAASARVALRRALSASAARVAARHFTTGGGGGPEALLARLSEQLEALRAEVAARDAALRDTLAELRGGRSKMYASLQSAATVGADALEKLTKSGGVRRAAPPPPGASLDELAPVAAPADVARLVACKSEAELVAAITPLLRAARALDGAGDRAAEAGAFARVLVNSERHGWLDAPDAPLPISQRRRPDLFVTWAPFWEGRMDAAGAVGVLAHRGLQLDGCVREFYEAKRGDGEMTAADFGRLVDYHSRVVGHVYGAVFNARVFWLYESRRDDPVSLTRGEWGAPGSAAALRRFFDAAPEPPLLRLLRDVCRELSVLPRRVAASGAAGGGGAAGERERALLGAGGSARVFSVAAADGAAGAAGAAGAPLRALKLSTALSRAELAYEFETLRAAAAAGAPVVPVVPGSLTSLVDDAGAHRGGGFLLADVCERVELDSAARCAAVFDALRALHAAGFVHGDARLPNLLARAGGELAWIDLRTTGEQRADAALGADARELAASALGARPGGELPADVAAAAARVPAGGDAAYGALAAAVWRALARPQR